MSENNSAIGSQRFSVLVFSHPILVDAGALVGGVLKGRWEIHGSSQWSDGCVLTQLQYITKEPLHPLPPPVVTPTAASDTRKPRRRQSQPIQRTLGEGAFEYAYTCYSARFRLSTGEELFLLAAPYRKILKALDAKAEGLASEQLRFRSLGLQRLCAHLAQVESTDRLVVTRINLQVSEPIGAAQSVTIFGDDVLRSTAYSLLNAISSPTNVRINYSNGFGSAFQITTDGAGNWSVAIRMPEEFAHFAEGLSLLAELGFVRSGFDDPRKRQPSGDGDSVDNRQS